MERYSRGEGTGVKGFLWLDSDANVATPEISMDAFLGSVLEGSGCNYMLEGPHLRRSRQPIEDAHLLVSRSTLQCNEPAICGLWFLRNTARGREILREWWNLDVCGAEFPWEQRALNSYLLNFKPKDIAVMDMAAHQSKWKPPPRVDDINPKLFLAHDGHVVEKSLMEKCKCTQSQARGRVALGTLQLWNVSSGAFADALAALKRKHIVNLSNQTLGQLASRVYDTDLAAQADRAVELWNRIGPKSNDLKRKPMQCRWIPVGYCDQHADECLAANLSQGVSYAGGTAGGWLGRKHESRP